MAKKENAPSRSTAERNIPAIWVWHVMQKKPLFLILAGLLLSGCQMRMANRLLGGGGPSNTLAVPTSTVEQFPTEPPTHTPLPPPSITPSPVPDPAVVGLPPELPGTTAFDFATDACKAEWSDSGGEAPCNGADPASSTGYAMLMNGHVQGLPSNIPLLLMYPPQDDGDTLLGKYPAFTVKKGDRFRAVLACRSHTFCDVEFGLEYYNANGRTGLAHWAYLFTDPPKVVDYSLDGIAGQTVQIALLVRRHGEGQQDYAVWIIPHVYRPAP